MKCVRCGKCCKAEICVIAEIAFGHDLKTPCSMLYKHEDGTYSCTFVMAETEFTPLLKYLGIGRGCDLGMAI